MGAAAASATMLARPGSSFAMDPDLAAHEAATTDVHGIPDTSVLAKYTKAGTFTAPQTFTVGSPGDVPVTVQGASGQNGNLTEWRDSSNDLLAFLDNQGGIQTPHISLRGYTQRPDVAPELFYEGLNGSWLTGIDVSAATPARDFVLAAKFNPSGGVYDLIYCSHRGTSAPVVGIGWTPPPSTYRVAVSPDDGEPSMGGVAIRVATTQKGHAFALLDSSTENPRFWIDSNYYLSPIKIKGDPSANDQTLLMSRADGTNHFAFQYADDGSLLLKYTTGGVECFRVGGNGRLRTMQSADLRAGAQLPYVGSSRPTGGLSGEIRVGAGKIWANDNGTWKSTATS